MASVFLPEPRTAPATVPEVLDPARSHRLLELAAPVLLLVLLSTALVLGGEWLGATVAPAITDPPNAEPEAVIRPGNGPAVAATAGARIVSLDCTLAGPVHVAEDDSGAYVVTAGAENVRCPNGQFQEGFTLRWPVGRQVATEPLD